MESLASRFQDLEIMRETPKKVIQCEAGNISITRKTVKEPGLGQVDSRVLATENWIEKEYYFMEYQT